MSSRVEIRRELRSFLERGPVPPDDLDDSASLFATGTVDETGVIELVAFLEGRFGIEVDDREIRPENFGSIAKLERFVARKLGGPVSCRGGIIPVH